MAASSKRLLIINLIWIGYCLVVIFFPELIPLEFTNRKLSEFLYLIIYILLAVSVVWTIIKVLRIKNPGARAFITTVLSIFFLFIFMIAALGGSVCGNSTEDVFVNRVNPREKIVRRHYGCGAWDSNLPEYKYYKVTALSKGLNFVVRTDVAGIDEKKWQIAAPGLSQKH